MGQLSKFVLRIYQDYEMIFIINLHSIFLISMKISDVTSE
jgi:hypothetical protein